MSRRAVLVAVALFLALVPSLARAEDRPTSLPRAEPAEVGMDAERLDRIDMAVEEALQRRQLPGAVVLVARQGKVVFRRAYGLRSRQPEETAMTPDTVFDLASLTKPVATASAVLLLVDRGRLHLTDRVAEHLPAFDGHGKESITVEQLLLHTSGLIPDNPVADYQQGRDQALERICQLPLVSEPGTRFRYSDVGYIVLGAVVERVSGQSLDTFTQEQIFTPLGLRDTTFKPGRALTERAAPTEKAGDSWLRGEVHDPRARLLGGVAGHAGLFSTADDLAVFAQMLLNGGEYQGRRLLSAATARMMTKARPVPGGLRTLGWDVQTAYSSNRGEVFPVGGFGHTGFTGTSLWIDPGSQTVVIVLSNRVHPDGKGDVTRLRGRVATLAAAAITGPPFPSTPEESPRSRKPD